MFGRLGTYFSCGVNLIFLHFGIILHVLSMSVFERETVSCVCKKNYCPGIKGSFKEPIYFYMTREKERRRRERRDTERARRRFASTQANRKGNFAA